MLALLSIMLNVIAPIFLVMGAGALVGRTLNPDTRGFSTLLVYLFIPALVFNSLSTTELPAADVGRIVLMALLFMLVMMGIGYAIARQQKFDRRLQGAFILSVMMVNAANYGIPLNTFAFGQAGGDIAVVYYAASAFMSNILGVYWASHGSVSTRQALMNVVKVPILYAAVAGLLVNQLSLELPLMLSRSVELAGNAAIPGMLTLLGLSLVRTRLRGHLRPIVIGVGVKLLLAPLVAVGLALLLRIEGLAFNVVVLESSMPTAVLATALAAQFGSDAEYTASMTLVATLTSVITLSVLIMLLGGVTV